MIQRLDVPMRVMNREIQFEVLDSNSHRYYYASGQGVTDTAYLGVEPPFKLETLPCARQIGNFQTMDHDSGSWDEARGIAKTIRERISKTDTHSN